MGKDGIVQDSPRKSYLSFTVDSPNVRSFLRTSQGKLREVCIIDVTLINNVTQKTGRFDWLVVKSIPHITEPFLGLLESMKTHLSVEELRTIITDRKIMYTRKDQCDLLAEIMDAEILHEDMYPEISAPTGKREGRSQKEEKKEDEVKEDEVKGKNKDVVLPPPTHTPVSYQIGRIDSWLRTKQGKLRELRFDDVTILNNHTQQSKKFDWIMISFKAHLYEPYVGLFKSLHNATPSMEEIDSMMKEPHIISTRAQETPSLAEIFEKDLLSDFYLF